MKNLWKVRHKSEDMSTAEAATPPPWPRPFVCLSAGLTLKHTHIHTHTHGCAHFRSLGKFDFMALSRKMLPEFHVNEFSFLCLSFCSAGVLPVSVCALTYCSLNVFPKWLSFSPFQFRQTWPSQSQQFWFYLHIIMARISPPIGWERGESPCPPFRI